MTAQHPTVLVTGATGNVGVALVGQLAERGLRVRAGTRDPRAARMPSGVEVVRLDLGDVATLVRALEGVGSVFLVWPYFETGERTAEKLAAVVEVLGRAPRHVVYLSSQSAETQSDSVWRVVEDAVCDAAETWTMLRPTGFAANAQVWADQIRAGDVVRWPFARLARPLIHEHDIAAVAAAALLEPDRVEGHVVLTGPELITQEQQVATIGEAIGRPLRWEELDRRRAEAELDLPTSMLDAWQTFLIHPEPVTDDVLRITGASPRSFTAWASDHAEDFRAAPAQRFTGR